MKKHSGARVLLLPVSEIRPNPRQPRQVFEEDALQALCESIQTHGILQPLSVRRCGGSWELVAGERRLRAAKMAGLKTVPCLELRADDDASAVLALVENLQRRDLHYLEEADAIAALVRETGFTQEHIGELLGCSASAVANKLRLLRLSPACRTLLTREGLSERHARALLRLEDEEQRLSAARHIASHHLTAARTDDYIDQLLLRSQTTPPGRRTYIIKDVRLFLNSVNRSVHLMRSAGVNAQTERSDTDDAILLTIRIPKKAVPSPESLVVTGL